MLFCGVSLEWRWHRDLGSAVEVKCIVDSFRSFFWNAPQWLLTSVILLFPIFNTIGRSSLLLIGMTWLHDKNSCLVNDNTDVLLVIIWIHFVLILSKTRITTVLTSIIITVLNILSRGHSSGFHSQICITWQITYCSLASIFMVTLEISLINHLKV